MNSKSNKNEIKIIRNAILDAIRNSLDKGVTPVTAMNRYVVLMKRFRKQRMK